jgi:protocatechuate 3,4-dioxygenase beta subunit
MEDQGMDNDDRQLGRILTRREVLALFGAAGIALLAGCGTGETARSTGAGSGAGIGGATASPGLNAEAASAVAAEGDPTASAAAVGEASTASAANTTVAAPGCVVRPEVTEGPYYVDEDLVRSDIREDREGMPLILTFNVSQVGGAGCTPLEGAEVEIWHCDAAGAYSDVSDPGFDTEGQKWLRGSQTTDASGMATFTTIYPGWYRGRAVHIHFKVRPDESSVFTSQLFFDDSLSDRVFEQAPYASKGQRDTLNSTDNIYQDLLLLTVTEAGGGYKAAFPIGIDVSSLGSGEAQQSGGRP